MHGITGLCEITATFPSTRLIGWIGDHMPIDEQHTSLISQNNLLSMQALWEGIAGLPPCKSIGDIAKSRQLRKRWGKPRS